jgi:predicted nucleic acid-binding protein
MVEQAGPALIGHALTELEAEEAQAITRRVAQHALSRDPEPEHHIGEAEVIVLARRPEFIDSVLLLDERAARAIAEEENLTISGFAGVLLLAVEERYLTAEEVKAILERCRAQGTHYSAAFVERMVQAAKEREG